MTDWVRLWHDMPTDPKWRVISRKSGQRVGDVIAVFTLIMTNASNNADERGTLRNWDDEDAAAALDLDTEAVSAILAAMQGKVLDGARLTGWEKRQVECGHGSNGGGTKSYLYVIANSSSREVKIGTSRNPWSRAKDLQTGTTGKTTVVATFPGVRSDETEIHGLLARFRKSGEWFDLPSEIHQFLVSAHDRKLTASALARELRQQLRSNYRSYEDTETETDIPLSNDNGQVDPAKLMFDAGVSLITATGKAESTARSWLAKARRDHGEEAVIAAISRAKREGAIEPISFMEVALKARARASPEPAIGI